MKVNLMDYYFLLDPDLVSNDEHLYLSRSSLSHKLFEISLNHYIIMTKRAEYNCKQQQAFQGPFMELLYGAK